MKTQLFILQLIISSMFPFCSSRAQNAYKVFQWNFDFTFNIIPNDEPEGNEFTEQIKAARDYTATTLKYDIIAFQENEIIYIVSEFKDLLSGIKNNIAITDSGKKIYFKIDLLKNTINKKTSDSIYQFQNSLTFSGDLIIHDKKYFSYTINSFNIFSNNKFSTFEQNLINKECRLPLF